MIPSGSWQLLDLEGIHRWRTSPLSLLLHTAGRSLHVCAQVTGLSNSEEDSSGRATLVPFLLEDKLREVCLPRSPQPTLCVDNDISCPEHDASIHAL